MNIKIDQVKIYASIFIILLISALFVGCVSETNDNDKESDNDNDKPNTQDQIIEDISNEDSFQMINENNGDPNFIIIDVRTADEYNDGHIENATNIDFYSDTFSEELDKLDRSKTYLIYCRSANRSGQTLDIMKDLEFSEVYNMLGGIVEWENNGYPIVY